jgi:hypothetical protein
MNLYTATAIAAGLLMAAGAQAAPDPTAQDNTAGSAMPMKTGTMYNGNNAHPPRLGAENAPATAIPSASATGESPPTTKGGQSETSKTGGGG